MAHKGWLLGSAILASSAVAAVAPAFSLHPAAVPEGPSPALAPPPIVAEPAPAAPLPPPRPTPRPAPADDTPARTLKDQRQALYRTMAAELDLTDDQRDAVKTLIDATAFVGQGNPAISRYGMKRSECRAIRASAGLSSEPHPPCDRANMVPLFDAEAGETAEDAQVCIDQFEFPDVPCEYPVVWASAREAAELCAAEGKRICDAHEWEGACAGSLRPPESEYAFDRPRPYATFRHNHDRELVWAYGAKKNHALCATNTPKTPGCIGGGWSQCGSNTYPAGAFPACVSPFGVYDQHGNAAEHMNLPLSPAELASEGGTGSTEMKGSWFVFQRQEAHEDDCRWRAKDWHPSKLMAKESHRNYHLGFRCCADVP
jgi:formylglycine-generating enzyme